MKLFIKEKEIKKLCCWPANPKRYTDSAEMSYSQGYWLKKFLFYPNIFDLYVTLEHGYYFSKEMILEDIIQDTNILFSIYYHYKTTYKKAYISGSPFIWYRRIYNIKREKSRYILAFPHHLLADVKKTIDYKEYIKTLKKLKKEYKLDILVCFYFRDIHKGIHKIYLNEGFNITTVGHGSRYDFIPRFYEILKYAKFTTSNIIGSYSIYSIEMGIPFLLCGNNDKKIKEYINENEVYTPSPNLDLEIFENTDINNQLKYLKQLHLINDKIYTIRRRFFLSFILYKELIKFSSLKVKRKLFEFYLEYIFSPKICLNLGEIEGYKKRYIEYIYEKFKLNEEDIKRIENFKSNIDKTYKLILLKVKVNYLGPKIFLDKNKDERYLYEKILLKIYKFLKKDGFLFVDYANNTPIRKIIKDYNLKFKFLLSYKDFLVLRKIDD